MTMGSQTTPFEMLDFDNNYATLVSSMSMPGTTITFTISMPSQTTMTMAMTANGSISIHNYLDQKDYSMTFTSFKNDVTFTMDTNGVITSVSLTTNGGFSETWTDAAGSHSISITFTNFKMDMTFTSTYEEISISGQVAIDFTPDECFEGTFVFVTVTPIRYDYEMGHESRGEIVINGNTHLIWNMGVITVWVDIDGDGVKDTGETTDYNDYTLGQVCNFATFDEETPPTTGTGGGTTTGNTMTITLSWTGGDTSDMDLHLNYYDTTSPTSTTTGAWYVDYHGRNFCTGGYTGADLDGDGACEVFLDFDDTEGYGPEHITASTLPSGYYVVSVNSFNLGSDPSANISVTIQIGDTIFGPYTHTFASGQDDGEGTDPNSWFAVADIVVDTNGNATVKAHDTALELWHDGAFGMSAPKKAKARR
jgi:uncharacterized protein YfaP (DUF2135 family)